MNVFDRFLADFDFPPKNEPESSSLFFGHPHHPPIQELHLPTAAPFSDEAGPSPPMSNVGIFKLFTCNEFTVSYQLLSLSGIFQALSHCYVTPMLVSNKRYRSVEHFVYQKFFKSLKFNVKALEKLVTTTDPRKLRGVVKKLLDVQFPPIPDELLTAKRAKMAKWYEKATEKKFEAYPILRQLLLATGDAFLVETNNIADASTSSGVTEAELQFWLTKYEISPTALMVFMLEPDKKPLKFRRLGRNQCGFGLMALRKRLKASGADELSTFSLFDRIPSVSSLNYASESMVCFTVESIFHPKYLSPIWTDDDDSLLYPSVDHYIFVEGAKFLSFPKKFIQTLLEVSADDVRAIFFEEIWARFPDPSRLHEWWSRNFDDALKNACRLKFEKHPDLLRILLETNDSLLLFCHRFLTANADWSVGMRESELREWKMKSGLTNEHLINMMLGSSKRPPFLGGNRLGFILMELRREFRLKGCQSRTLPRLISDTCSNDVLIGEASGLETGDEFDSSTTPTKYLLWPSPYVLECKERSLNVWYPGKRKLSGFYPEGFSPENRRPSDMTGLVMHPEYASSLSTTKTYSISSEFFNLGNSPEVLKRIIENLMKKVLTFRSEVQQQNEELDSMLDEMYEKNYASLTEHEIVPGSSNGPSSNGINSFRDNPAAYSKLKSFERGFLAGLMKAKDKKQADASNELRFTEWDGAKCSEVVEKLYTHLSAADRRTALDWMRFAILKLNALARLPASMRNAETFRTFVPTNRRDVTFSLPQFFQSESFSESS